MLMGASHRLQHGLRFHPAVQPAPLPVDELAVPGRRHDHLAARREPDAHHARRSVAPERLADAPARTQARPRSSDAGLLGPHPPHRQHHDRPGDPGAPEGLDHRRRRRARRHRLPEPLEGHPAEPPERQGPHARHPGLLEHRRPELRQLEHARRLRHEPVRPRLARAS